MKTITYRQYDIGIVPDIDPMNPRDNDDMCTMQCFHKRYLLGDQDSSQVRFHDYHEKLEEMKAIEKNPDYFWKPIYMYEHSGITISTKPFSCRWDSGRLGIIYVSKENAMKALAYEFDKKITCTENFEKRVYEIMEAEVSEYDSYLRGEIYGYQIFSKEKGLIDSSFGYYSESDAEKAAKEVIDIDADSQLGEYIPGLAPADLQKESSYAEARI